MAWLLYGQRADGELLHISEADRGDDCGCFCPHCQAPLAAKKGKVKVHHFAHLGKTCSYVSAYDFLHIEHYVDTTMDLAQWAGWKQQDMEKTAIRLQAEYERYSSDMAQLLPLLNEARSRLEAISQPHPSRKQRSKTRQANFEVLQQWDAYVADHNAEEPDLERVRDLEGTEYRELYYRSESRWRGRYVTGLSAWPNELWHEENKDRNWIPWWLEKSGLALLNDYSPLRRKLATAELHLDYFHQEKTRFDRFRLYFLLIEFANRAPLFKIGITSRSDLSERIAEIRTDLQPYNVVEVTCLAQLSGHAFLETYFKHKYARQQAKLGHLTEYFSFDDQQLDIILTQLKSLSPTAEEPGPGRRQQIRQGMAQARQQGVHVGRPQGSEADERFLQKPKSQQVAAFIAQHPDWSLREVARQSGVAINTVCKVARLLNASREALQSSTYTDTVTLKPSSSLMTPYKGSTDETEERRRRVIAELEEADDYLVITVSATDERDRKPIGMHISRLNAIGPALVTLMQQDRDFCEAMGELVQQARIHRPGGVVK